MADQWVTMSQAAETLNVPLSQISRLAREGKIRAEKDTINKRVRLVNLPEVRALFESSRYYSSEK